MADKTMEMKLDLDAIREFAEKQFDEFNTTGCDTSHMVGFEYEGMWIINPFVTECGRFEVDPIEYYGQAFLQSDFLREMISQE